ncbi:thioredoxin-dependent thiol peroxidase [Hyphomicrobium sp.]|uniref:thioredoxin-dependent thiol peroxidase n=1 Tax=Hyphomicrobium sp. TaxID=82 RepID=UPI002CF32092|nr:thioredoxin-dependent thiol peroxidase [Hyphomicrobium sp.]HRN87493.1 thioredoxin-dependent thiol peroxidase [Hyphomicrobium sp.]HRQ26807.1 thioredoxin-dependent thiol peroxidase [Hyphomicrobium sp.]
MLQEGDVAPAFVLPTDEGKPLGLKDFRGRSVVVYFYPRDDTPGCTLEAQEFAARAKDFAGAGAVVIGISPDSPACHARFKTKHGLDLHLASDEEKTVVEAYGVWVEKSMYGRKYMGVERATFLISAEGRIAHIWRKVKPKGHAAEVLAFIKCGKPGKTAR